MKKHTEPMRKITVNIPAHLIDGLADSVGVSQTEVICRALKEYRHDRACRALLALEGKIDFSITRQAMKDSRE